MMTFIWVAIIILAVYCEAQTSSLVSIWFMPSGVVAMILSMIGIDPWIQTAVFFVLSFILLTLCKTVFKKYFKKQKIFPTNTDLLIGQKGIVTEKIDNIAATGSVKVKSQIWTARSSDENVVIYPDSIVVVKNITGVKLIVEKDNGTVSGNGNENKDENIESEREEKAK